MKLRKRIEYSAEYFEKYSDLLMTKYKNRSHCDLEYLLALRIPEFKELPEEIREKAIKAVTKIEAQKISDMIKNELVKTKHMINDIVEGKASLGFTTEVQEIQEWHDLNESFYFTCYVLSKFKKKYEVA